MKKLMVLGAALCVVFAFSSCKSQESAYKKAYEQAKAAEENSYQNTNPVVTPVVERPVVERPVVAAPVEDNTPTRSEDVSVVSGGTLKAYSVVVGAFSQRANADGVQSKLKAAGYNAMVVFNADRNLYRVVASTFDSKADAVASRNELRNTYTDAWLLYKK